MFLAFFIPVLLLGGDFIFLIGWSLWSGLDFIVSRYFTLYFTFYLLPHCLYFVGLFMLGGVFFLCFLFQTSY